MLTADGWYKTGTCSAATTAGAYTFVGRTDDMFVCGGENIYPGEVESLLEAPRRHHSSLRVPVPDEIKGDKPFAFVVPRSGACLTEDEIKRFALDNAPAYQHPRGVVLHHELAARHTNKVDRKALRAIARERWSATEQPNHEASRKDSAMKAAVIYEHGGPGSIRYVARFPDPKPDAGEVVVRVKAASLNYHDIFTRRGMPGIKVPMPCIMGIDFAGEIVALGDRRKRLGSRRPRDDRPGRSRRRRWPDRRDAARRTGGILRSADPQPRQVAGQRVLRVGGLPAGGLWHGPADDGHHRPGEGRRESADPGRVRGGVGTCCVQLAKLAGAEVIVCASSAESSRA